jgi:hypothetical protein
MSEIQMRSEIVKFLTFADDRLLSSVYAMMKSYLEHEKTFIGTTTDGKPLTKEDLIRLVEISRLEGLEGKTISNADLLSSSKSFSF